MSSLFSKICLFLCVSSAIILMTMSGGAEAARNPRFQHRRQASLMSPAVERRSPTGDDDDSAIERTVLMQLLETVSRGEDENGAAAKELCQIRSAMVEIVRTIDALLTANNSINGGGCPASLSLADEDGSAQASEA